MDIEESAAFNQEFKLEDYKEEAVKEEPDAFENSDMFDSEDPGEGDQALAAGRADDDSGFDDLEEADSLEVRPTTKANAEVKQS